MDSNTSEQFRAADNFWWWYYLNRERPTVGVYQPPQPDSKPLEKEMAWLNL